MRIHSGNCPHEEMDRRAIACFDQALLEAGLADDKWLRQVLHDYFAWATTTTMSRYHSSAQTDRYRRAGETPSTRGTPRSSPTESAAFRADLAQMYLDDATSGNLVVCRCRTDTVLDLGTGSTIPGPDPALCHTLNPCGGVRIGASRLAAWPPTGMSVKALF